MRPLAERHMRRALFAAITGMVVGVATSAGCGAPTSEPRAAVSTVPRSGVDGGASDARADAPREAGGEPLPSFEALAALAPEVAPGLREAVRGDLASGEARILPEGTTGDTCMRIVYGATSPNARLVVAEEGARDAGALAQTTGVAGRLGRGGPVCFTRGHTLRLENAGEGAVRFVAWSSH